MGATKAPASDGDWADAKTRQSYRCLHTQNMDVLFDLILYVPSTIFQLRRNGSSWVEPVLSFD